MESFGHSFEAARQFHQINPDTSNVTADRLIFPPASSNIVSDRSIFASAVGDHGGPLMTKVKYNSALDRHGSSSKHLSEIYADDNIIREIDSEISELEKRLKDLRERRRQNIKGKQTIYSTDKHQTAESDLKKIESQCKEKILKSMKILTEVCKARGYVYGILLENADVVTNSSYSLRDWWTKQVRFDCYAPSVTEEYQLEDNISSCNFETSLDSSATSLMVIQDKTLGSLISSLIPRCNPPQRKFPLDKGKSPPWWPKSTHKWWQNIPLLACVELPPYRKPHDLKKTWKILVLLEVIRHMAPEFGIIKIIVKESRSLKDKMTPKEIFLWNSVLTHERRLYLTLKNDKNLANSRNLNSNSVDVNGSTANNQAKAIGKRKLDQMMEYIDEDTMISGSCKKISRINEITQQSIDEKQGPQYLQFISHFELPNEVQQNNNFFRCPYSVSLADQNGTDQLQGNYNINNVSFIQQKEINDQNPIHGIEDHARMDSLQQQSLMDQDALQPQAMLTLPDIKQSSSHGVMIPACNSLTYHGVEINDEQELDNLLAGEIGNEDFW